MLKFLGKVGKGFATVTGSATAIAGVLAMVIGPEQADAVGQVLAAVGSAIAVFGVGRKAAVAAGKP